MGEVVVEWRRAYGVRPPPMTDTHPHWPLISLDSRYRGLKIPESESLRDTANRVSMPISLAPLFPSAPGSEELRVW